MRERIDSVLRDTVDRGEVPGVVAMATNREGPIYDGAFGRRALPDGPAMTLDTVFLLASMTKPVTSVAAMQLVERGRLDLEAPLGAVMPDLAQPQVLEGFDAAGEPRLRPAKRPITLRHLLTHTSGFGYDIWNPELRRYHEKYDIPRASSGDRRGLLAPLVFDPGERWEYGINTDWVGKIVETVSGQDLESYCRQHILGPLGMADTAFRPTPERVRRQVGMHARRADGHLETLPREPPSANAMGGGGLHGTAPDYIRFVRMILNEGSLDGTTVLRPETVRAMARNQMGEIDMRPLPSAKPELSNPIDFFPEVRKKWGLGFMINETDVPGGRSAGSLAWAGLRNTYFWIDPAKGIAGVLLTQLLPFADPTVLRLLARFEQAVYAEIGHSGST